MADPKAYVLHTDPVWRDRSNFVLNAALPEDAAPKRYEQLFARKIADQEFELCCIPFFLYDLALGDVFTTAPNADHKFVLDRVIRPSGRYTFRVWFGGGTASPKEVAAELEQLDALLEWSSAKLLALDTADSEQAQVVANYLQARENAGQLTYETGRTVPT
jgi:hypothetical protein